ncbi:MAG TPA: CBS domain-containing protein [Candidatus Limnocylindrales bacterium]|nr:CBS domain-containing protein [Candidatus Limnocylindrales bacterium]
MDRYATTETRALPADWRSLRVADIMTIDPVTISSDASIESAERLLRVNRITGLPVLDPEGDLVGVISQTDLLLAGRPSIEAALRNRPSGLRVGELMTSPALTVPLDTPLHEAARLMRDAHVHRLVAVDDERRPVGVLAAMDYVMLFAET